MTLREALEDVAVFGATFAGATWAAWRTVAAVLDGLPLDAADLATLRACTGRTEAPTEPARELWCIAGRRSGKSLFAAACAVHAAVSVDRSRLAPGERPLVLVCAVDQRQARNLLAYAEGLIAASPLLAPLLVKAGTDGLELANGARLEVRSSNFRSVRGVTLAAGIIDEVAFLRDESSAVPDLELYRALRPALATTGGRILALSSPWAQRGLLWSKYKRHFGKDGPVLVWQAGTERMHPGLDAALIAEAREDDPEAASAEWDAAFRTDLESYVSTALLDFCTDAGVPERPPVPGLPYVGFVDAASGTGRDSFTAAVAHRDAEGVAVLDAVYEVRPPFDALAVVREVVAFLARYGCTSAQSDAYAAGIALSACADAGLGLVQDAPVRSDLYLRALPLFTSGKARLLDDERLRRQLVGLERRRRAGGRDVVDHPPGQHDDVANAVVGALVRAAEAGVGIVLGGVGRRTIRGPDGERIRVRPLDRDVVRDI